MQILKKSLSILLSILMVFSLASVIVSAETVAEGEVVAPDKEEVASTPAESFTFDVSSGTSATVTGYVGEATDVIIPSEVTIDDVTYPVTAVADGVFAAAAADNGKLVTSVVFPESVTTLGKNLFQKNTNITAITVNGKGVTFNTYFAESCSNLATVTINGYVKALGGYAFAFCNKLTELSFPEGLIAIYDNALRISSLKTLRFPSTLKTIEGTKILNGSLAGLRDNLTIYVPDTKTEAIVRTGCKWTDANGTYVYGFKMIVGDGYESDPGKWKTGASAVTEGAKQVNAYSGTSNKVVVPTYDWEYKPLDTLAVQTAGVFGVATDVMIPETVIIRANQFKNNPTIQKATVNTDINVEYAFSGCSALKEVVVNGVISANFVFAGSTALEKATISDVGANVLNLFHTNPALTELTVAGNLPDTTLTIVHAPSTVPNLKKLIIAETGSIIGANGTVTQFKSMNQTISELEIHGTINKQNCFYGFTGIETLKIFNTASISGDQIFRSCTGIKNVIIEENTTIGSGNFFQGCTSIKSVVIPRNVKFTSYGAFSNCSNLTTVDLRGGCKLGAQSFIGCNSLKHVIVRDGAVYVESFANTATNENFVTYYLPTWYSNTDTFTFRLGGGATTKVAKSCWIGEGIELTDNGGDYLVPSSEGQIFAGFVTAVDGKVVTFDTENQSQGVSSFYPLFVKAQGGDVNGDSKFNILDLIRYKKYLADALGTAPNVAPFIDILADLNADGECDVNDLAAVAQLLLGDKSFAKDLNDKITAFDLDSMSTLEEMDIEPVISEVQFFDEEYAYNHHPHITKFNGVFYAIFSQGYKDEDDFGQRVMYAYSEDGVEWSIPDALSDTCMGELYPEQETVQFPLGFFNDGEILRAFYSIREIDPESVTEDEAYNYVYVNTKYYYTELVDGEWSEPVLSECALGAYENAKFINGYWYTTTGTGIRRSSDGITWYTSGLSNAQIAKAVADGAKSLAEGTLYVTDGYVLHLFMRGGDNYIWHSISVDGGLTWSDAYRTALTNDYSKLYVGQLDDGRYFIVNNPVPDESRRNPLCISISDNGYDFSSTYIIVGGEGNDYTIEQPGIGKGWGSYAYPSCYVDGDMLYVIYSCGKEIINVVSFDVSGLI